MKALWEYEGLSVEITLTDGEKLLGYVTDYYSAEDNESGRNSIYLKRRGASSFEIREDEIGSIMIPEEPEGESDHKTVEFRDVLW